MKKKHHLSMTRHLSKIASLALAAILFLACGYLYIALALPDVSALKDPQLQVPLKVYSRDGQLLGEFGEMQRTLLTLDQVPPLMINAVLATEDQRFYEHGGIDFWGILRAGTELLLTGRKSQGGSTITMQVARNFYLSRQKTFTRKLDEVLLAMKIEQTLSKEKILELYLNKIYLGKRAYGVAAAAQVYYGKPLDQLTLPEFAMIAGLPKAPSTINPVVNPKAAIKRRNHVLGRMHELGYIDKEAYMAAIAEPSTAKYHGQPISVRASYIAEMVRNLMLTSFGSKSYTEGYKVYTTVDSKLQTAASHALRDAVIAYDQRHGYHGPEQYLGKSQTKNFEDWQDILEGIHTVNGLKPAVIIDMHPDKSVTVLMADGHQEIIPASDLTWGPGKQSVHSQLKVGAIIRLQHMPDGRRQLGQVPDADGAIVALNPQNGGILALVGGFDYRLSNYNRVTQAQRQPGSSFKPFIYSAALDKDFTLASIVDDAPFVYVNPSTGAVWRPQNDDHQFWGPMRLREALARSRNLVSVRLLQAITVPYTVEYLKKFGFDPKRIPAELSIALGSASLTPLEMATGYAVFANGGYQVTPYLIERVDTNKGKTIYEAQPKIVCENLVVNGSSPASSNCAARMITPENAFLMTSALQEVIRSGTGRAAQVLMREDLAGKTGTSNDMNDAWFSGFNSDIVTTTWVGFDDPDSLHEHGAQAALPMWIAFMHAALEGKPEHTMLQPPGIVTARIDPITGLLAHEGQEDAISEYFREGTVPPETSSDMSTDNNLEGQSADKLPTPNDIETSVETPKEEPLF